MKKYLFISLAYIFLINNPSSAQKKDTTAVDLWVPSAAVSLNISQIALSNWTQGGENSLTWVAGTNMGLKYLGPMWNFRNNLKVAYGRTRVGSEDFRTNDNELFFETVISKKIEWAVDPYFSNTIRTALTTGYNYKVTPAVAIADFFDPGYVSQGVGFTYDKLAGFRARIGFAAKETFTKKYRQYSDNPLTEERETFKLETGFEAAANGEIEIMKNTLYKGTLRLFTRFEHLDVWDIRWDNSFVAKINDWINVNLTFLLIYEKKQSLKTQLKESLQLGIVYTIL